MERVVVLTPIDRLPKARRLANHPSGPWPKHHRSLLITGSVTTAMIKYEQACQLQMTSSDCQLFVQNKQVTSA